MLRSSFSSRDARAEIRLERCRSRRRRPPGPRTLPPSLSSMDTPLSGMQDGHRAGRRVRRRGEPLADPAVLVDVRAEQRDVRVPLVEVAVLVALRERSSTAAEVGHVDAAGDEDSRDPRQGTRQRPRSGPAAKTPPQISSASSVVVMSRTPADVAVA